MQRINSRGAAQEVGMNSLQELYNQLVNKGDSGEIEMAIIAAVEQHEKWRTQESINLHAGKNVMSEKARRLMASPGLVDHSVSGAIAKRNAAGARFIDEIETLTVALLCRLFHAQYVEYRAMSGNLANGIALCALTRPGDTIMVVPRRFYGHYSWLDGGYPRYIGLRVEEIPFKENGFHVDTEVFRKKANELRPTLIIVGTFIHLFPTPLAEIREVADSIGSKVMYDGAHVMGLIAGQCFQDPLSEGAHILTGSTQKTLPGPIGGILACNDPEIGRKIVEATDGLLSNYANNRVAAMAMSAAEMLRYGKEYAAAIVKNAQTLAEALDREGLTVIGKSMGYTASHQVIIDAGPFGAGRKAAEILERANLICTRFALSSDYPQFLANPNGVRFGVSAVTRLGMGSNEIGRIARLIKEALVTPEKIEGVRREVKDIAGCFSKVRYSFDS